MCLRGYGLGFEGVCGRWMGRIEGGDLKWIDFGMMRGVAFYFECFWCCHVILSSYFTLHTPSMD